MKGVKNMGKLKLDSSTILSAGIFVLGAVVTVLTNKKSDIDRETMKKEIINELIQKK